MYFFKKKGKQHLDLQGDLVLTHNKNLISTRNKSASVRYVHNGKWIGKLRGKGSFWLKVRASFYTLWFIWLSENQSNDGDH